MAVSILQPLPSAGGSLPSQVNDGGASCEDLPGEGPSVRGTGKEGRSLVQCPHTQAPFPGASHLRLFTPKCDAVSWLLPFLRRASACGLTGGLRDSKGVGPAPAF